MVIRVADLVNCHTTLREGGWERPVEEHYVSDRRKSRVSTNCKENSVFGTKKERVSLTKKKARSFPMQI